MNPHNLAAAASPESPWTGILIFALAVNAALVFGYRVYRLSKGGPLPDAIGGAILASMLVALGAAASAGANWARWGAVGYGVLFGVIVMPIWTLAVFLPARPGRLDNAFIVSYWVSLAVIALAGLLG